MLNFIKKFRIKRHIIATLIGMHFFGNPSKKLKIIGVTGTNGKTTTVTLLYKVTSALGYKTGLISTIENKIDSKIIPHNEKGPSTTPDPIYLNKLLKKMVKEGCKYVFMEVSSHALAQKRVAGINFNGGIFTNLTHDHLDYHKDLEEYFSTKKKFFEMLPKNAFALSNIDDKYGIAILDNIKAKKSFYGFENKAEFVDFSGKILESDFSGLKLSFSVKNSSINEQIYSKLLGKFNAYNLLTVWSVLNLLNFDMKKVNKILENIEPPQGRFENFMSPNGVRIIIDYAHTPDALKKILLAIKEIKSVGSKIISVFGCGGDRDSLKRPIMGHIGASLSDIVIITSDNPRNENPNKIIKEMTNNLSKNELKKIITISDRRLAIAEAMELAKKGDIILCAGKGHENYQEIKGVKFHFDDTEEFKRILKQKR